MKFNNLFIILLLLGLLLTGCGQDSVVLRSLPEYTQKEFYTEGGFQDFTDYGVYTFARFDVKKLEDNLYFEKVTDPKDLRSYVDNFEGWLTEDGIISKHYGFDKSWIDENDYVFLETKEGESIGTGGSVYEKFDNYSIWFFDTASWKLYYFHSNI